MLNLFIKLLYFLGDKLISNLSKLGKFAIFTFNSFVHTISLPLQFSKIIEQIHFIGTKSVFVICLTGAFTGMVLALQGYYTLAKFGSTGMLGSAVAFTIIRELGPVFTAIMIIARAGSAITAEIGIMRTSEQIDALDTMDINPIRFLISPKLIAGIISFPILTALFDIIGILGGFVIGSGLLNLNAGLYFYKIESSIAMADIKIGFIKSIVFAIIVITISCYYGYYTHLQKNGFGAKGVSFATTSSVIRCSIFVLISDYIVTSMML